MVFVAKYVNRAKPEPPYYRTVHADTVYEATKIADRYTRKGFICVNVKEKIGGIR